MDPRVAQKFADRAAGRVSVQTYPANPAAEAARSRLEIKLARHAAEGKVQGEEAEVTEDKTAPKPKAEKPAEPEKPARR